MSSPASSESRTYWLIQLFRYFDTLSAVMNDPTLSRMFALT